MADALIGSWKYDSVEGLEEYMTAAGLPDSVKEMARNTDPKVDIAKDGDAFVITTTIGDKVLETRFPVGVEVETTNIMGKTAKSTLTVTPTGLLETQKAGDKVFTIDRSVKDGVFISVMAIDGVEAKAKFFKA